MIDYKEAKKYLLPTLLDYGFKERKDKSLQLLHGLEIRFMIITFAAIEI